MVNFININFVLKIFNWGDTNFDLQFEYGDNTNVASACGASLFGEHFVFGGDDKNQVFVLIFDQKNNKF